MSVAAYRDFALKVARDPQHPLHLLPRVPPGVHRILDVGCHAGHILEALRLADDCEVFGCDINREALALASNCLPKAHFKVGMAEALPYDDGSFDFVFARGVMVALDVPRALAEFHRVLTDRGRLWLSLHRWQDCQFILRGTWKARPIKTLAIGCYAALNGISFHCTGKLFHYPLNRSRMMSFQTESRMRSELTRAGFRGISFSRGTYLVVEAEKCAPVVQITVEQRRRETLSKNIAVGKTA